MKGPSIFLFSLVIVFSFGELTAQHQKEETRSSQEPEYYYLKQEVINGDTIAHVLLGEVRVLKPWKFKNKKEKRRYTRLVKNIKIALPYARLASKKLNQINQELASIKGEKNRKEYLKKAEKELFAEFEAPLRKDEYDAEEEDRMIEHIIGMIDNGAL